MIKEAMYERRSEGQGISRYNQWRNIQPGFIASPPGITPANFAGMYSGDKNVSWDGTFNQPILPLADTQHRESKYYYNGF